MVFHGFPRDPQLIPHGSLPSEPQTDRARLLFEAVFVRSRKAQVGDRPTGAAGGKGWMIMWGVPKDIQKWLWLKIMVPMTHRFLIMCSRKTIHFWGLIILSHSQMTNS